MNAPPAPLDHDKARAALAEACGAAGLDPAAAELIRLGDNAVFRLRGVPVIARVARSEKQLPGARRELLVSRWLAAENIPVVRPLDVPQPILAQGRVVVLWESASDSEAYGTTAELGVVLRALHTLTPPPGLSLPSLDPFARAWRRMDTLDAVSEDDRTLLRGRLVELEESYHALAFDLPIGVVHGDANVGNLIRDRDGHPLLADLDGFSHGPREWDLVLTALYYERYGWHSRTEYRDFIDAYGYDVMPADSYRTLADLRELLMVTWLAQNAPHDPRAMAELTKRITTLRTGSGHRNWQPF
ncbi:phosphotransferase enzyme family protein [Plantactinospora sp. CA-290183]|uniref:phosphotransferase enzyme family protein n=1 Tax=Plantactinospora sp. CA-290183 TaxID=3240006 RepID=UPI003D94F3AC